MGIISLEKQDHLFWLGRYCERVYTTIRTFQLSYDKMLDNDDMTYKNICELLDIPDIYKNQEDFIATYIYAGSDPNSIYSNLRRAYDNAVVLRDEISSTSLSYIQMALDAMEIYSKQPFSLLQLYHILDYLLAFWGSVDDYVVSDNSRDLMKCGRHLERLDLYIRLGYPRRDLDREMHKFEHRMERIKSLPYDYAGYKSFCQAVHNQHNLYLRLDALNQIFMRRLP